MKNKLQILVLDDEKNFRNELVDYFNARGHEPHSAGKPSEAFQIVNNTSIDIAFVDIVLPEMSGLEVMEKFRKEHPGISTIAITGHGDMTTVINTLRAGAVDFLSKPFGLPDMDNVIKRTTQYLELQRHLRETELNYNEARKALKKQTNIEIVGSSPLIKEVLDLVAKVSQTDSTTVLITGESGTGKELVARCIHAMSSRKDNFFHSVNCSAIPETLFESEFFGHSKGAFTDARQNTEGWFEISQHGALFLDEIGELPLNIQAKFLRVLDDKVISKIGTKKEISLDLRIVAATNQNLEKMVEDKTFRIDLFHRLNSFVIHVPPLRERKEDIPELINYFVNSFNDKLGKNIRKIDKNIFEKLQTYHFPGNVRELKNIIERAMIICEDEHLQLKHLFATKNIKSAAKTQLFNSQELDLEKLEKKAITQALHLCKFNKSKTAKLLNISRQSLDRRLEKFNITEEQAQAK